ncbi:hypothetical protein JTE90_013525 [Oedothorax gibbosus]|uniref:Uncharacterized protein n=1 Tax=Oedothorax gibbosus TaxID=931172 RepID=A0AAV6U898_9ARAC|nr:hypothetical protein JTE90_013525 [Oedothorax gibbosus]
MGASPHIWWPSKKVAAFPVLIVPCGCHQENELLKRREELSTACLVHNLLLPLYLTVVDGRFNERMKWNKNVLIQ